MAKAPRYTDAREDAATAHRLMMLEIVREYMVLYEPAFADCEHVMVTIYRDDVGRDVAQVRGPRWRAYLARQKEFDAWYAERLARLKADLEAAKKGKLPSLPVQW